METIVFGAGCFWGVQSYFDNIKGVKATEVGYAGGDKQNPSYEEVCSGKTGHVEVLKISFDRSIISLKELSEHFFEMHDPTQQDGQGPDIGEQYLSRIFYTLDSQVPKLEETLRDKQAVLDKEITTKIEPLSNYFAAEEYHQKYNEKNGNSCKIF